MYEFENELLKKHFKYIAGVDEVGRGPLAGPVVAAAVILDPDVLIDGLNDSKQLTEKSRQKLFEEIKTKAVAYSYAFVSEAEIDRINIYQASKKAMFEALGKLNPKPEYVLSDAMPLEGLKIPFKAIVKGDALSASIAAASIVAKVVRDDFMVKMDLKYPGYNFAKHKGYPTPEHLAAIKKIGICKIHRKTFKPVKEMISKQIRMDFEE